MGSPFFVEIYDPNKIRIEGTKTGTVNERMEFDSMYLTATLNYIQNLENFYVLFCLCLLSVVANSLFCVES